MNCCKGCECDGTEATPRQAIEALLHGAVTDLISATIQLDGAADGLHKGETKLAVAHSGQVSGLLCLLDDVAGQIRRIAAVPGL